MGHSTPPLDFARGPSYWPNHQYEGHAGRRKILLSKHSLENLPHNKQKLDSHICRQRNVGHRFFPPPLSALQHFALANFLFFFLLRSFFGGEQSQILAAPA